MTITINGTTGIAGVDGSASTPAVQGTDTNTGIFFPAADTIAFGEGGAEVARFDSNGSLLIATTNAITGITGAQLTVSNPSENPAYINIFRDDTTIGNGQFLGYLQFCGRDATSSLGTAHAYVASVAEADHGAGDNATAITFGTTPDNSSTMSERARITSGGNFLVGTTDSTIYNQSSYSTGLSYTPSIGLQIKGNDDTTLRLNRSGTTNGGIVVFYRNGTNVGNISVTGSDTTYNTASDYRLKENIVPMTGALATVAQLKPCTYTWKSDGSSGQGFIAHELQSVVPKCVTGDKDAVNEDGSISPQGIDTSFLVATLTAAIQELKAELDTTKARLAALENK
jgi:hypothetical protein